MPPPGQPARPPERQGVVHRLNPRKADLHRWRETLAEKLPGYGIEAEATRQATRGVLRNSDPLWRVKAKDEGRLRQGRLESKTGRPAQVNRARALEAWSKIMDALGSSDFAEDRQLAADVCRFMGQQPGLRQLLKQREAVQKPAQPQRQDIAPRNQGPEFRR